MRTIRTYVSKISTSVLLIVGPKCTLAASNAAPSESRSVYLRGRQTDGRTDGRTDATPLHYALRCGWMQPS